ncbi:tRNA (adenosine(37)-N6)-threonylcarbamoyltransferase complex dimerization subunit type 1 TsaB [Crocinitomicaceae bacterium]|nr:tRNA (adenosine(37)-N6)-threonylcarbamoyltransferase complex dimerization subunit type 1 TsaB [Crocinitomicaceae bacterium]
MTYILHLETATKVCSVALSKDGELIAIKEIAEENYSHAENITLFIEDVLKQAEISIKDIHAVSVSSGPGSYTGLRIGVSTAKGLCYPLNIPLIAIDSLKALSEIARIQHPKTNVCPLIDARRMEVFNAIYSEKGEQIKPISADIIEETTYSAFEPFVYFGDGADKLQEIWKGRNCTIDSSILSSAKGQVSVAYKKFLAQDYEDVAYFEPFYLKDFVAGKKVNQG